MGLEIEIDTTKPILELIEKHILNNYNHLRSEINHITGGYHVEHTIYLELLWVIEKQQMLSKEHM